MLVGVSSGEKCRTNFKSLPSIKNETAVFWGIPPDAGKKI